MARAAVRKARMRNGILAPQLEERGDLLQDVRHGLLVHEVLQGFHHVPPLPTPRPGAWVRQPSSSSSSSPTMERSPAAARRRAASGRRAASRPPAPARRLGGPMASTALNPARSGRKPKMPSTRSSSRRGAGHEDPVERLGGFVLDDAGPDHPLGELRVVGGRGPWDIGALDAGLDQQHRRRRLAVERDGDAAGGPGEVGVVHQRDHLVHRFAQPFVGPEVAQQGDHFPVHQERVAVRRIVAPAGQAGGDPRKNGLGRAIERRGPAGWGEAWGKGNAARGGSGRQKSPQPILQTLRELRHRERGRSAGPAGIARRSAPPWFGRPRSGSGRPRPCSTSEGIPRSSGRRSRRSKSPRLAQTSCWVRPVTRNGVRSRARSGSWK